MKTEIERWIIQKQVALEDTNASEDLSQYPLATSNGTFKREDFVEGKKKKKKHGKKKKGKKGLSHNSEQFSKVTKSSSRKAQEAQGKGKGGGGR